MPAPAPAAEASLTARASVWLRATMLSVPSAVTRLCPPRRVSARLESSTEARLAWIVVTSRTAKGSVTRRTSPTARLARLSGVRPVPKPRPYLSAREAFLYLILFATLYVAAWNLGSLLFDLINRAFPDPTATDYQVARLGDSIRWSASSVIIAFPVFLYVAWYLGRELARSPIKRLSAVRRWLTYLTLFVAAAVLIGDMITLVYNVLGGELSIRFVLKVLVAAVIAGTIFGFYLHDLRREEKEE